MPRKRIRIDLEDSDGAKYNFNLEGNVTREKILKIFELMDLMNIEDSQKEISLDSVGAKIWNIVDKYFPVGKFTSSIILEKYEDEYNEFLFESRQYSSSPLIQKSLEFFL